MSKLFLLSQIKVSQDDLVLDINLEPYEHRSHDIITGN